MNKIRELTRRLRMLLFRRRFDADLEEEMHLHIELREEELRREEQLPSRLTPAEARAFARRQFGNVTSLKETSRLAWGWEWLDNITQDLRYGLRMLRKSPGFSAIAILTIALGVGATTAIFSVVDATLLHPLSYPHPEQLVSIQDDLPGIGAQDVGMSVPELWDYQRSGIFQYVSAVGGGDVNLTGASQPERIRFLTINPTYFAVLGVQPQLGHSFDPNDRTPGFNLEAIISDGLWKRAFASDPGIIGRNLRLDGDLYRVIGVMPPDFHDPGRTPEERNTEAWLAAGFAAAPAPPPLRSAHPLQAGIARLQPGLSLAAAQSQVDALVANLQRQFPADYPAQNRWHVRLVPMKETIVGDVRQSLILLLCAVGLVLLIGCVNIANLLLARASSRSREIALRQALGAARHRLIRQLLTESLLLSLIGGLVGLAVLFATKEFLLRLVPDSLPRLNEVSINWAVLLFALLTSLVAGTIFGLAPALQSGKLDLLSMLKRESRGSSSGEQARTRRLLVVAEFALSLVLMIAAGLLLRSFWDLLNVRPGFNTQNAMAVRIWLPIPNDEKTDIYDTIPQESALLREILRRAKTIPGVNEAAIGNVASVPLGHAWRDQRPLGLILEGHERDTASPPLVNRAIVSPEYFHLLGMTLLRGRFFTDFDDANAPAVSVVNDSFARSYWPGEDALGKRFKRPADKDWTTVVGVVADARTESLTQEGIPETYFSAYQSSPKALSVFLRGQLDPAAAPVELHRQVQSIDPQLPVFGAHTLDEIFSQSLAERRFSLQIIGLFSLTALLLAGLGIYGVISYMVSERTREIGIRLALGAPRENILRMVLRQGLTLAIYGAAVGLVCALIVTHLMAGLLYGVHPTDPLTFIAVPLLLLGAALLACYLPARRAIRIDPLLALRHD